MLEAKWSRLIATQRLYRSSQTVTVVGQQAYIFGGELVPRQPIDNKLDVVEISESGKRHSLTSSVTYQSLTYASFCADNCPD